MILVSIKKIGGNHAFFLEIIKLQFGKKTPYIALYFAVFLNDWCLVISKKCVVTPNFLFGFQ